MARIVMAHLALNAENDYGLFALHEDFSEHKEI